MGWRFKECFVPFIRTTAAWKEGKKKGTPSCFLLSWRQMSSKIAHKMQPAFQTWSLSVCRFLGPLVLLWAGWSGWDLQSSEGQGGNSQEGMASSHPPMQALFCCRLAHWMQSQLSDSLVLLRELMQGLFLNSECTRGMRQDFWVEMGESDSHPRQCSLSPGWQSPAPNKQRQLPKQDRKQTLCHPRAPEFLPLAASLQSDRLLTFPSFACHFFSKLHLDFRLPIKLESRFSSKNLQCEHLVRRDLTGPL